MIDEAEAITQATGNAPLRYTSLVLAAWRGDESRNWNLSRHSRDDATAAEARDENPWPST